MIELLFKSPVRDARDVFFAHYLTIPVLPVINRDVAAGNLHKRFLGRVCSYLDHSLASGLACQGPLAEPAAVTIRFNRSRHRFKDKGAGFLVKRLNFLTFRLTDRPQQGIACGAVVAYHNKTLIGWRALRGNQLDRLMGTAQQAAQKDEQDLCP